jgi:hypothetical protein
VPALSLRPCYKPTKYSARFCLSMLKFLMPTCRALGWKMNTCLIANHFYCVHARLIVFSVISLDGGISRSSAETSTLRLMLDFTCITVLTLETLYGVVSCRQTETIRTTHCTEQLLLVWFTLVVFIHTVFSDLQYLPTLPLFITFNRCSR